MRKVQVTCVSPFYRPTAHILLLIIGQIRRFRDILPYLWRNVISVNPITHIVFSLDCRESELTPLYDDPFWQILPIKSVFITDGYSPRAYHPCHVEFALVYEAIDMVDTDAYEFIMVTRTDILINLPFRIESIYSPDADEWARFADAHRKILGDGRTPASVVYDYLLTAGHPEYIETMNVPTEHIYWCPVNAHEWNRKILETSIADAMDGHTGSPAAIVKTIATTHRLCYLIGSTWFRFGWRDEMVSTIRACRGYNLTYTSIGRTGLADREHATEAQLRLSYFTQGFRLIDIIYQNDYLISFHEPETNPHHYVYILRSNFDSYSKLPLLSR